MSSTGIVQVAMLNQVCTSMMQDDAAGSCWQPRASTQSMRSKDLLIVHTCERAR